MIHQVGRRDGPGPVCEVAWRPDHNMPRMWTKRHRDHVLRNRFNQTHPGVDGYAASHRAVRELKADGSLPANTRLRSSKYLNNLIEQDHRGVKQRIAVMLGFKEFRNAAITIAGIELLHRIRKGQFRLGRPGLQGQAAPEVWNAVLGA